MRSIKETLKEVVNSSHYSMFDPCVTITSACAKAETYGVITFEEWRAASIYITTFDEVNDVFNLGEPSDPVDRLSFWNDYLA